MLKVYRTREEVEEARRSRDPITKFGTMLMKEQGISEEGLQALASSASGDVEAALEFAQQSPEPPAEGYQEYVYV